MPLAVVTGGRGGLGREVVPRLQQAGYSVRVTGRGERPADFDEAIEWAQMSLETGEGMDAAIAGSDVIVHLASSPFRKTREVDVLGTRGLLERARASAVPHFFYISIVGIDKIPFAYYRMKLAAERAISDSRVPYSILRATQFHTLLDRFFTAAIRGPIALYPTDFKFQTIDTGEVAARMVECIGNGPSGMLPEIGGPEVLTAGDMLKAWLSARAMKKRIVRLPVPGKVGRAFRAGLNCCPDHADGKITWQDYLDSKYGTGRPT